MSNILFKKFIYVHSEFRLSGNDSNFTYDLGIDAKDYDTAVVLQASIPKSYYLIQAGQNTFTLDEINNTAQIELPVGNYSRTNLKTVLQTLLNENSPNGWVYTITFPPSTQPDTGKYTFTVTGNGGVQPRFIFTTNIYKMLGFDINSTNEFITNSLESKYIINLQKEPILYLHSDIVDNKGGVADNVLQGIYGTANPDYGNIIYQCFDLEAYSKSIKPTNTATFYLTDSDDNTIDLNGQNFHFTLLLYKKQPVYELVTQYLKLDLLKTLK